MSVSSPPSKGRPVPALQKPGSVRTAQNKAPRVAAPAFFTSGSLRIAQDKAPLVAVLALVTSLAFPGPAYPQDAAPPTKVLLFPYQSIYRSVGPSQTQRTTDLVTRELSKQGRVTVVRAGIPKTSQAAPNSEPIGRLLASAAQREAERDVHAAISAREEALRRMERDPTLIRDPMDFIRGHHELARALFWSGQDRKAEDVLERAARMGPNFELSTAEYSRFYRARFRALLVEVLKEKPSRLLVRSSLPGTQIYLDGREAAVAPVRLEGALPGKHLLHAEVAGAPPVFRIVTLAAGAASEVTLDFGEARGGAAVGVVAEAIAQNQFSAHAVREAARAGRADQADFVIAGGVARDATASTLNVHTFVVNAATGGVAALRPVRFDLDMLTAASDVIQIVRAVEQSIRDFGDAKRAIALIQNGAARQELVDQFDARPRLRSPREDRAPSSRRIRRPVKAVQGSGTVRIKDEE